MNDMYEEKTSVGSRHVQRREHLKLFFTVNEAIVVLHRDEWGQVVCHGVVCGAFEYDIDIIKE